MTKLAPEWVRTSDPVIRSPARYRWTTAPASPAVRADLKSAMSTSVAGMADCSVRRMGETGSSQTLACTQLGPARTAHQLASVSGCIPHVSSLLVFGWQGHCELPGSWPHCSHLWSAPAVASHSEGWRASKISFGAFVHGALDPHVPCHVGVGIACDGLGAVSMKECDLVSRERCQHSPEIRHPPAIPIVGIRYHPWHHGA